jgi:hypothetical protein
MAFQELIDQAEHSTLEYRGTEFRWHLDGMAIHKAQAEEGIDVGSVFQALSIDSGENLGEAIDAIVKLVWMGLEEDLELNEVRKAFSFRDMKEIRDLADQITNAILPEEVDELPQGDGEKP